MVASVVLIPGIVFFSFFISVVSCFCVISVLFPFYVRFDDILASGVSRFRSYLLPPPNLLPFPSPLPLLPLLSPCLLPILFSPIVYLPLLHVLLAVVVLHLLSFLQFLSF